MSERGTEIALFDYAYYNEKIYNNISIIFYDKNSQFNNNKVIEKNTVSSGESHSREKRAAARS